ncbi:TPA: hypothetical protein N0F65_007816 [Lagenidium giganteum]|uniref:Amino acid transporter n=1 Tax=Lagenidium giganteum TaxID=4803 RepID=A0AAV2YYV2_9STRA|nr:TPA: hypothetical protein N0F65_007816 [Lagenidium giganteum]
MRPLWILVAIIASIAIGVVLNTVHLSSQVGYWIDVVGQLYRRSVNCITLPLAFCQVVVASSSLTSSSSLKKLWIRVGLIFALVVVVSSSIGIILMEVMRPMMRDNTKDLGLKASHPPFAFKCPNAKFLEQRDNGTLTCTGDSVQPNTTFPWMVDKSLALGLDEPIPSVNISQYLFSLLDMYFPDNIFVSFAKDLSLSVCVVAMALGVAITRSFHGAQRRGNPLLRLFLHIYSSLATMLEWVQSIALIATFPLIIGAIVKTTDLSKLLQQTQYFCLGFVISLLIQGLVIMPAIFFLFTRRNPYSWLKEVMAPALYGFVLMNPLLPLNMATKTVLRTKEVSSPVFGAVYPVLASLNRISFALALPNAVVFAAAFTECEANMDPADVMLLYAMSIVASFGDTALSKSQWAFFMTTWRTFCPGIDIPTAMIALQNTWLLTSRLTAFFDSMTNLMIVRMVSNVVNPPEAPAQRSALHTAQPI